MRNLRGKLQRPRPQGGQAVVPQGGFAPQARHPDGGQLHNFGMHSHIVGKVGKKRGVQTLFGADEKIEAVFPVALGADAVCGLEGAAEGLRGFKSVFQRDVDDFAVGVQQLPGGVGQAPFFEVAADALAQNRRKLPVQVVIRVSRSPGRVLGLDVFAQMRLQVRHRRF